MAFIARALGRILSRVAQTAVQGISRVGLLGKSAITRSSMTSLGRTVASTQTPARRVARVTPRVLKRPLHSSTPAAFNRSHLKRIKIHRPVIRQPVRGTPGRLPSKTVVAQVHTTSQPYAAVKTPIYSRVIKPSNLTRYNSGSIRSLASITRPMHSAASFPSLRSSIGEPSSFGKKFKFRPIPKRLGLTRTQTSLGTNVLGKLPKRPGKLSTSFKKAKRWAGKHKGTLALTGAGIAVPTVITGAVEGGLAAAAKSGASAAGQTAVDHIMGSNYASGVGSSVFNSGGYGGGGYSGGGGGGFARTYNVSYGDVSSINTIKNSAWLKNL